jgi:hypothetical protein
VDSSGPLLAVDDEHASGGDHQVIDVDGRPWDGQVVEDEAVTGEPVQQAGGTPFPLGAAPPSRHLLGEPEPVPPADEDGGRQADQTAVQKPGLDGEDLSGEAGGGDQRRPPG